MSTKNITLSEMLSWPELTWTMDLIVCCCAKYPEPVIRPGVPHPDGCEPIAIVSFTAQSGRSFVTYFIGEQPTRAWCDEFFARLTFILGITYPG